MKVKRIQKNQISTTSTVNSKEFTACQMDILYSLLMVLNEDSRIYTFTKAGIEQLTGRQWTWDELQESTKRIGCRMIVIETPESLKQMWLFGRVSFATDESQFTVYLNTDSIPYLMQAKSKMNTIHGLKQIVYPKDHIPNKKRLN